MKRKTIAAIILAVLVALSAGYDFWRGYHDTGMFGGIVYVIVGFGMLGVIWLISRSNSN